MPFLGKSPKAGNFIVLDSITTSATATYNLTRNSTAYFPASARNLIVSLNGITQAPDTAYSVSGSTITFSSALTSSDVIDYILVLGDVLTLNTPADNTVGTNQMSYPLGNFSSTGIDDNATSTALTFNSSQNATFTGYVTATKAILEGSYDNILELRSTDDGPVYIEFERATDRHAYLGFGGNNDVFKINNEESAGEIQFLTANTAAVTIDENQMVGIGITNPSTLLQVRSPNTTAETVAAFGNISINNGLQIQTNGNLDWGFNALNSRNLTFSTNQTERMRIDSVGSVGIGTGSGAVLAPLHVDGSSATGVAGYLRLQNETGNTGYTGVYFSVDPTYAKQAIYAQRQYPNGGGSLIFALDTATDAADVAISDEKMRIDNSGHLIVPNGVTLGTAVGTYAASNTLNDYEEGTWTPTVTTRSGAITTYSARYVKVGAHVTVHGYFYWVGNDTNNNSNQFFFGGLPYTLAASSHYVSGTIGYTGGVDITDYYMLGLTNSTSIYFTKTTPSANVTNADIHTKGLVQIIFSMSYITDV